MTARPILFSAPMVRAILDGTKTQTRRIVKHRHGIGFLGGRGQQDDPECWGYAFDGPDHHGYMVVARGLNEQHDHGSISLACPYGDAGDRLWVRETFRAGGSGNRETVGLDNSIHYRADLDEPEAPGCWKPSIFMRRRESRITLAVESVRVERLQAITEADARAEGVTVEDGVETHRDAFERLWGEINGAESWAANPWVWVVTFARVRP